MPARSGLLRREPVIADYSERAIEDDFPFEEVSELAEVESWRKEIWRPIYHIHKWWAQRLGSVFRATIIAAAASKGSDVMSLFYEPLQLPGIVVFDPFMGSGTIIGEAHKLGCTAIGRDINPVAYRAVRAALSSVGLDEVHELYKKLEASVGEEIRQLYRASDGDGQSCDVLYYFWVKVVPCPRCGERVDLFPSYVFATNVYKSRRPDAKIICPECNEVLTARYDTSDIICRCGTRFNPQEGPAKRTTAVCRRCAHEFSILKAVRATGRPPAHRLYAKLVLRKDGSKQYLPITQEDLSAFEAARKQLSNLAPPLPRIPIPDGYNTRQILNYGYRFWHELFNERQLLALSMLANAIAQLPKCSAREVLVMLFSGILEFNNMFASYKGEGTGAVRHMFSHHILKPERMPIEANVWGTTKSSGAFSTLYRSRIMRALSYRLAPYELAVDHQGYRRRGRKIVGISPPMGGEILDHYPAEGLKPGSIYLSCGDSSSMDLPDMSVDLVITDPPFFDNVHYSELADFFYVWQQLYFSDEIPQTFSTRHRGEVQDGDSNAFAEKLRRVFAECHRVLRDSGLLILAYHHSREEGWTALAKAVTDAGFTIVQSHPVKAEMSVAAPKSQAKEPISIDILLVCRKQAIDQRARQQVDEAFGAAVIRAVEKVNRFNKVGRRLSRNDVRVILLSQLLVELSAGRTSEEVNSVFDTVLPRTRGIIEETWRKQNVEDCVDAALPEVRAVQLRLLG